MIKFPCMCSFELEVPDELAGGLIQCPRCGRLCDIPTLDEVAHLRPDGTIELEEVAPDPEADRLQRLDLIYRRSKVDDAGMEIDLRPTQETFGRTAPPESPRRVTPKYDPVTGELVRPLELKKDPDAPTGPIPVAKAALTYSTDQVLHRQSAGRILLELFMPVNMFVMFFAYLGHALPVAASQLIPPYPIAVFFALVGIVVPVTVLVLAHYANVVEDSGPDGYDELHRPLRNLALWEDLLGPFGRMLLTLAICYGPAVYVVVSEHVGDGVRWPLAWILAIFGTIALPAVLLTVATSGSVLNLRPDRVLSVVRGCGADYVFAVLAAVPAVVLYIWNIAGFYLIPDSMLLQHPWLVHLAHDAVTYTLLGAAVYFGHFFCWYLGVLYRRHYGEFEWVLQRHIPRPKPEGAQGTAVPAPGAQGSQTREPQRSGPQPRPRGRGAGMGGDVIP